MIWIDPDAAGHGWFIGSASPVAGTIDLRTAVAHEFGHVLGFDHDHGSEVMAATLEAGQRLLSQAPLVTQLRPFAAWSVAWLSIHNVLVTDVGDGDFNHRRALLDRSSQRDLADDNVASDNWVLIVSVTEDELAAFEQEHLYKLDRSFDGKLSDDDQQWNELIDRVFEELAGSEAVGLWN